MIFEAIYRPILTVQYYADNPYTEEVESLYAISNSTGIVSGSVLGDVLTSSKINQLTGLSCNVEGWEFKHWAVNMGGELIEFDILTDELLSEYADENHIVKLVAVYGPIGE